jgi:hypothetical protein
MIYVKSVGAKNIMTDYKINGKMEFSQDTCLYYCEDCNCLLHPAALMAHLEAYHKIG